MKDYNYEVEKIVEIIERMMSNNECKIREYADNDKMKEYFIGKNEGLFYAHTLLTNKFDL